MPIFWIPWVSCHPSSFVFMYCTSVITPYSLQFHNLVTYVLKIFLFGIICGPFQFVPQSPVILLASFSVDILPFPSFIYFTDHFLCNPWLSCSLLYLTTRSLIVSNTHSFIFSTGLRHFHCHIQLQSFFSRVSCTFCRWTYNFSKSHCGLLFWNLIIF